MPKVGGKTYSYNKAGKKAAKKAKAKMAKAVNRKGLKKRTSMYG